MYLNCKTFFSYRYGTFSTEALVQQAVEEGATAMALTNINNTADLWDFYELCTEKGIKPVLGCEVRNGDQLLYLLLAKNLSGVADINCFLTVNLQAKQAFPFRPALGTDVWVVYPLGIADAATLDTNELIGVQPTEINKLYSINTASFPTRFVVRQPVTFKYKSSSMGLTSVICRQ